MIFVATEDENVFDDISELDEERLGAVAKYMEEKKNQEMDSSLMFIDGKWVQTPDFTDSPMASPRPSPKFRPYSSFIEQKSEIYSTTKKETTKKNKTMMRRHTDILLSKTSHHHLNPPALPHAMKELELTYDSKMANQIRPIDAIPSFAVKHLSMKHPEDMEELRTMDSEIPVIDISAPICESESLYEHEIGMRYRVSLSSGICNEFPEDIDDDFSDFSDSDDDFEEDFKISKPRTSTKGHSSIEMNEFQLTKLERDNFLSAQNSHNSTLQKPLLIIQTLTNLLEDTNTLTKDICRQWVEYMNNINDE